MSNNEASMEPVAPYTKLSTKVKRGTETRDQDITKVVTRHQDPEKAVENHREALETLDEFAHKGRSTQPRQYPSD